MDDFFATILRLRPMYSELVLIFEQQNRICCCWPANRVGHWVAALN